MKLSLSGKVFGLGAASYLLGSLLERAQGPARATPLVRVYTPQNVIGLLTYEQVSAIQTYADDNGIRRWDALEVACQVWNEWHQANQR